MARQPTALIAREMGRTIDALRGRTQVLGRNLTSRTRPCATIRADADPNDPYPAIPAALSLPNFGHSFISAENRDGDLPPILQRGPNGLGCRFDVSVDLVAASPCGGHDILMSGVLNISAYDRALIIDTQVVLETKPLDQLPWGEFGQGPILLLVCRQAQSEIDAKKNDGRLGTRARTSTSCSTAS